MQELSTNGNWMPRIDADLCNGCGECIALCPTGSLGSVAGKAALVHPEACTYCAACESVCPVNAIELPYLICTPRDDGEERRE
jgi:NAD-dependent dihydropyrimidine dehydrogenase PreA subunit